MLKIALESANNLPYPIINVLIHQADFIKFL